MLNNLPKLPVMAPQLSAFLPSRERTAQRPSSEAASSSSISGHATLDNADSPPVADCDQLVVSNAVIGLIAASAQTYNDLDGLTVASNAETKYLSHTLSALKSFKLTIQLLYKFLRRLEIGTLERKDRPSLIGVDVLIVTLSEAAFAISEIGNLLLDAVGQVDQRGTIEEALQERRAAFVKETKTVGVADVLMTKLISVLQV